MYSVSPNKKNRGFTLIELLVVIAIIGLLSSIVLASLNTARLKAREAQRQASMHSIVTALEMYYLNYGCLPMNTGGTTCPGAGGYVDSNAGTWDYSSQGAFMAFLKTAGYISSVPVDPVNNMTGDGSPAGTYAFRYYCYPGTGAGTGPQLSYWSEITNTITTAIPQPGMGWTDPSFTCK